MKPFDEISRKRGGGAVIIAPEVRLAFLFRDPKQFQCLAFGLSGSKGAAAG
jgi:hypothetical protein